jgi:DNA polymerase-3 subunit delta
MPPRSSAGTARATGAGLYLLQGQDDRRKREALRELLDQLVDPSGRDFDLEHLDADTVTAEEVLAALGSLPMFAERRVVVLLNAGRLRYPRQRGTQERLAAVIPSLPESACLVLVAWAEAEEDSRRKSVIGERLEAAIKKAGGEVMSFAPPRRAEEAAPFVVQEAKRLGKTIAPPVAVLLARRVGPDLDALAQEMAKLSAYAGDRSTIGREDVELLSPRAPDDNVFAWMDAVMAGNRELALRRLQDLLESGEAPLKLIAQLAGRLREVWQAKYLLERRIPLTTDPAALPDPVREALPGTRGAGGEGSVLAKVKRQPWAARQLAEDARAFSWPRLHRALPRLAEADAGIKGWESGVGDPRLALELLVVALCE